MDARTGSPAHRRGALAALAAAGLGAGARPAGAQPARAGGAGHVVLLGDSVFDNAGYLRGGGGPEVVAQLRARLPAGWRATLLARGGAVAADVPGQLARLPAGATHLVVSAGGNDAARREGVLGEPARSVAEGLARIAAVRDGFARDYRAMLDAALGHGLPVAVCTVYDPRFPEPVRRQVAVVALAAFNDVVSREAFARGAALLDLRLVCDRDEDFAGATGPSVRGGAKIAAEIAGWAAGHDPAGRGAGGRPGCAVLGAGAARR
jgi:GDSL-like lipase/acylhydrolase family protein